MPGWLFDFDESFCCWPFDLGDSVPGLVASFGGDLALDGFEGGCGQEPATEVVGSLVAARGLKVFAEGEAPKVSLNSLVFPPTTEERRVPDFTMLL